MSDVGPTQLPSVAAFYKFVDLASLELWQQRLQGWAEQADLRGTLLLAQEGVNGTLVGTTAALRGFVAQLHTMPELADMPVKFSLASGQHPVFHRLKVKIKSEIVAMGLPAVRPAMRTGTHVGPDAWHALLDDAEVPVIDVRNRYETEIGQFHQAIDPDTQSFREFPEYVAANLDPVRHPKVAMYCTGGIRCEKASAYLLEQGFAEVYQLDGGILNYFEQVPSADNRWQGECFVFDQRVSVDQTLNEGAYQQCFACRHAITAADRASPKYIQGQSCPKCYDSLTPAQRSGFAERQRQVELAQQRGTTHIGANYND